MTKKRSSGEGSVFKREDGRWVAAITLPDGKKKRKYAKTQKEARGWLLEMQKANEDGLLLETKEITVAQFLDRWMKDVLVHRLRAHSLEVYEAVIRKHLKPTLGHLQLSALRSDHLQHLYSEKLDAGLSTTRVRFVHVVMHGALEQAVKWGLVSRNVSDLAEQPRPQRREMKTLSQEQTQQFLKATREHRYHALFVLAVSSGMRMGELIGLRWEDVDLDKGVVRVRRAVRRLGKRVVVTEPKSAKSRRSIIIPQMTVSALREHRKRQLEERLKSGHWPNPELVFTTVIGTPLHETNLRDEFWKYLEKAGLPKIRFHDLRHTAATLLLAQGVHPKVVQEMLGHSTITMTLDIYSHVTPTMQEEAAARMEKALGG